MRERKRERGRDTGRGRGKLHAGSPMWDLIPGLDPRTPGSCPGQKAGTKPLSHPGIEDINFLSERKLRDQPLCLGGIYFYLQGKELSHTG